MILLFEDKENTPSSQLLKKSLYGENIKFSGSNTALSKVAEQLKSDGHKVIIFFDLAVNNRKTKELYESLSDKYEDDSNILVLPIICIEYYILKMLYNHGFLDFDLYKSIDIQYSLDNFVKEITGVAIDESIEKHYKHILNQIGNKNHCYNNKTDAENKGLLKGKFYTHGCPCERTYCKVCKTASIAYKAESLYSSLPVFFIDSKYKEYVKGIGLELNMQSVELKGVYNKLIKLHTRLHNLYGENNAPVFKFNDTFSY